ncbi:uncharacterized protein LOC110674231 [Aedes aegypti]|uniref:Uncharacterized protein n=1 Tax=Aedes aegypti TaxID=7159 RepID=A0A6I8TPV8_AEDAE|nr:uncharacterized protein LOC110674231 [Aedes aegypti]
MLSAKVSTLCEEDLSRYRDKIAVLGGEDPYNLQCDANELPLTVDYDMILCYLLNTLSFQSNEPLRNRKSLDSYKNFERGFVKEVKGCKCDQIFVVRGKVLHSMRVNDPAAECWILIQNESVDGHDVGEIRSAHCDCTAGAGETCSHVAAVLYALSYARETCLGKQISVTQLPAYWCQPSGSAHQNLYKPVDEIDFGRSVQTTCELRDYELGKTEDELKELINNIAALGQDVAASKAFFDTSDGCDPEDYAKRRYAEQYLSFSNLFEEHLVSASVEEIIDRAKEIVWTLTEEDCELVEELTRDQSSDPLWFKLRYGRITASTFGRSVKTKISNPSTSLLKTICGSNLTQELPATLHGKRNEHKAITAAIKMFQSQNHSNFSSRKSGLIINPLYPYFAASPDFIFECTCCNKVVVEAKCPFKFENLSREEGINSLLNRQHPYILMESDGNIVLNHNHEYYYQIQMQIFLADASYGIFVVWASNFTLFIKVTKNAPFWEENSEKATLFFENVLAPEIIAKHYTSTDKNTNKD